MMDCLLIGGSSHGQKVEAQGTVHTIPDLGPGLRHYRPKFYYLDPFFYCVAYFNPTEVEDAETPALIRQTGLAHLVGITG